MSRVYRLISATLLVLLATAATLAQGNLNADWTVRPVSCFGGSDGSIDLVPVGGTQPYTFEWSDGSTTEDLYGLTAGIYTITITDAAQATVTFEIEVAEPTTALDVEVSVTTPLCYGDSNGSIDLQVSGGTEPYYFEWGDGFESEDRMNLAGGTYPVTVMDNNGCRVSLEIDVEDPPAIEVSVTQTGFDCSVGYGTASVIASGGTGTLSFVWSNGQTGPTATGLEPGPHSITVTDENQCEVSIDFEILATDGLTVQASNNGPVCAGTTLRLYAAVGGEGPFTFLWSGPGGYSSDAQNPVIEPASSSVAGVYTVMVTNPDGCQGTASTEAVVYPNIAPNAGGTIAGEQSVCGPYDPDPVVNVTLPAGPAGYDLEYLWIYTTSASVVNTNTGTVGVDWWMSNGTDPMSYDPGPIEQTTWYRRCVRVEGCIVYSGESNWVMKEVNEIPAVTLEAADVLCHGGSTGSVTSTPSGNAQGYSYSWTGPEGFTATTQNIEGLSAGVYTLVITNLSTECSSEASVEVGQPPALEISETHTPAGCSNAGASIDITVSGGVEPYSYLWSNGSTSEDQEGLESGTYAVKVTDANGCEIGLSVTVEGVNSLVCSIERPDYTYPVCGVYQSNTLNATITGGSGIVEMRWAIKVTAKGDELNWTIYSGQGTPSIVFGAGKHPAAFILTVRDEAGCESTCTYKMEGCRENYFCTYTQGAYGHDGTKICTPDGPSTINKWMQSALPERNSQYFGMPANKRYFELKGTDISRGNIFVMLPGGGYPRPLTGYATFDRPETWRHVPLEMHGNQKGKIKNILLSQAITLWFNIAGNRERRLDALALEGKYMITAEMKDCDRGFAVPYEDQYTIIPEKVLRFLNSEYEDRGGATVGNLMDLANRMLGVDFDLIRCWRGRHWDDFVWPGDVVRAMDAINRGFEECRILVRFTNENPEGPSHRDGYRPVWAGADEVPEGEVDESMLASSSISVTSFPNPFVETATIEFSVLEAGHATLEVLSPNGAKVETLFDSEVRENETYRVQFKGEVSGLYIYKLITPTETTVGKMISIQR